MKDIIGLILAVLILLGGCGAETDTVPQEKSELGITTQGMQIRIHDDAEIILETLGKPIQFQEVPSCAFDGVEKSYFYGNFSITTRTEAGREYIQSLWLTDDTISTEEGIRIGDTREAVETAYGSECKNGSDSYVIQGEKSKLTILLKEELVTSIQYEAITP